eukprot:215103_1
MAINWAASLICILVLIVSYYRNDNKADNKLFKYALISMICFAITSCIEGFNDIIDDQNVPNILPQIGWFLSLFTWSTAQIFMYIMFILKIKISFEETIYKIQQYKLTIFYILLILFFIITMLQWVILQYMWFWAYSQFHEDNGFAALSILNWLQEFIDVLLSVLLTYYFLSSLFRALDDMYVSMSLKNSLLTTDMDANYSTIAYDTKLITVITKSFILAAFSIIFNQMFFIFAVTADVINDKTNNVYGDDLFLIQTMLRAIGCAVNCICMGLTFQFNHVWYDKCCKAIHGCCYKLLRQRVINKHMNVNESISEGTELSVSNYQDLM